MSNKKHLALTISAIMSSAGVNAAVDLNTGLTPATFASEIVIAGTTDLANTGGIFDITNNIGAGMAIGETHYLRYDLPVGVTFVAQVIPGDLNTVVGPGVTISVAVSSGGSATDNFVIFSATAILAVNAVDEVIFSLAATGITVSDQNVVTMTYNSYDDLSDALGATPPAPSTSSSSAPILTFAPALSTICTPAGIFSGVDDIDISQGSLYFDGGPLDVDTRLGDFRVAVQPTYLDAIGNPVLVNTIVDPTTTEMTVTANSSWSAITVLTDVPGAAIFALNGGDFVDTSVDLSTYTGPFGSSFTAAVPAGNTVPIEPASVFLSVNPGSMAGYNASTVAGTCLLSEIERNGSHDRLTFALTPGGTFRNLVRITNPSPTAGAVFMTVYDDTGAMASFPISAINDVNGPLASGPINGILNAEASTVLLDIVDIANAAVAANGSLDITAKLRIEVDAEFGNSRIANALDLARVAGETSVNIQSFSMSKDGNSFFMLQKD